MQGNRQIFDVLYYSQCWAGHAAYNGEIPLGHGITSLYQLTTAFMSDGFEAYS